MLCKVFIALKGLMLHGLSRVHALSHLLHAGSGLIGQHESVKREKKEDKIHQVQIHEEPTGEIYSGRMMVSCWMMGQIKSFAL